MIYLLLIFEQLNDLQLNCEGDFILDLNLYDGSLKTAAVLCLVGFNKQSTVINSGIR